MAVMTETELRALRSRWAEANEQYQADADLMIGEILSLRARVQGLEAERDEAVEGLDAVRAVVQRDPDDDLLASAISVVTRMDSAEADRARLAAENAEMREVLAEYAAPVNRDTPCDLCGAGGRKDRVDRYRHEPTCILSTPSPSGGEAIMRLVADAAEAIANVRQMFQAPDDLTLAADSVEHNDTGAQGIYFLAPGVRALVRIRDALRELGR